MSPKKRSTQARKAARARWSKTAVDMKQLSEDRVYRRDLANKFARGTDVDPGDLEHVLYNLTLLPMERLARGLAADRPKDRAALLGNDILQKDSR